MAFGGLLDVLTVPVTVDDGWGGSLQMTHRAYVATVGVMAEGFGVGPVTTADPIVCTVRVFVGKVVGGEFKPHPGLVVQSATFTRAEVKAMAAITIAALIDAAKAKLQIV
jgi:hypothetical protein